MTMIKMFSAEQLNTNRDMHGEEEVRDGDDTRMSKRVFFIFPLSEVDQTSRTVPRAETAPPPSSGLVVTLVISDGFLFYRGADKSLARPN